MAKQKQKVTVNGMVGWSLLQTAHHHGLLTHCEHGENPWDYVTFGEVRTRASRLAHGDGGVGVEVGGCGVVEGGGRWEERRGG